MPMSARTSGGTEGEDLAAARMRRAITMVAERDMPHWQLMRMELRETRLEEGRGNALDEDAFTACQGSICKGHSSGEAIVDEVLLTVGPLELEIVHAGSATGQMCGIVGGVG
jgi:hypothetical protein